jgi:hypothetical protein
VEDPARHLVQPPEPDPSITKGYVNPLMLLDAISPAHWVNEALTNLTGKDIIGTATAVFVGDWAAYAKFGTALQNLGDCLAAIGVNVQDGVRGVDQHWDGNASEAAYSYFTKLAIGISEMRVVLGKAAIEYEKVARFVWQLAEQVSGVIKQAIDKVILAGICAAAGTVTASTGIGALLGYGAAAWVAVDTIRLINRAELIIQTAGTVVMGAFSALVALASQGGHLTRQSLPEVAYQHPAIAG